MIKCVPGLVSDIVGYASPEPQMVKNCVVQSCADMLICTSCSFYFLISYCITSCRNVPNTVAETILKYQTVPEIKVKTIPILLGR